MYVLLKPFDPRHDPKLRPTRSPGRSKTLPEGSAGGGCGGLRRPPIDGMGTTGGYKLIVEDRGNLGLDQLQRFSESIVARGGKTDGLRTSSTVPGPTLPGCTWISTEPSACFTACRSAISSTRWKSTWAPTT